MDENEYKSPIFEAAVAMHEMFLTFMAAGFTESQALILVADILRQQK